MTTPRLTPEQQALCSDPRHLEMARRLAARYARRCPWLADEFESAALFGLVDAATRFDPARGLKFATLAKHRVAGTVIDAARRSIPKGYRRGASAPSVGGAIDFLASGELPVGWELESADEVRGLTQGLTVRRRTMVRLLYSHAATPTMTEVARAMRCDVSLVSMSLAEALAFIRGKFRARARRVRVVTAGKSADGGD